MKSFWCIFVMISVLFMSVDGAADLASPGHPHGGDSGHFIDAGTAGSLDSMAKSDSGMDHCEHCCHGHTSSITVNVTVVMPAVIANDQRSCHTPRVGGFAQAPPTPPPNA